MSKSKVLVTGGAGFVGSHLVDALLDRGHEVRIYDNLTPQVHSTGIPGYLSRDAEFLRGDMLDVDRLRGAVRGMDVVFHLAAAVGVGQSMYEISHYMAANTLGTANLLQVLIDTKAQVQKLVVASSMSIYGEGKYLCAECGEVSPGPRPLAQLTRKRWEALCPVCHEPLTPLATDESKPLQCTSIYALSKKDQEEMALLFGRTYGIPTVALLYFNIYGTRQSLSNPYTGVAAIFASRMLNGRAPLIFEDGCQARDFVSVEDVTRANLLAMETAAEDVALNVGSGEPVTVRQVAQALGECMGASIPAEITGKYRAGDIRHCFADITAARRVLGYSPKVPFAEGFRNLAQWLRQQTAEDSAAKARRELEMYGLTA
jgi:dTDP-L-rhamnose 4-epimerase